MENSLRLIQPDLTLYGVYITFVLTAFYFGRFFWKYEKELRIELINRLKELMSSFRRMYIDPKIEDQIRMAVDASAKDLKFILQKAFYEGKKHSKAELTEMSEYSHGEVTIDPNALLEKFDRASSRDDYVKAFTSTSSGSEMLDKLDKLYLSRAKIWGSYHIACKSCAKAAYSCICLALLFLIGMLQIFGDWPILLFHGWLFLAVMTLYFVLYWFISLEKSRRELFRLWEDQFIYGRE